MQLQSENQREINKGFISYLKNHSCWRLTLMGGDQFNPHHSSIEDEESSNAQDFSEQTSDSTDHSRKEGILGHKVENGAGNFVINEFGDIGSYTLLASEVNLRRNQSHYAEVLATYDELQTRSGSLMEAKNKILSYTPGSWIDKVGGFGIGDYHVPQTTTLLLVGPKGSGKSSLVNKISRSFEHDKFAPERAQVSNGSSVRQGTFFLQEYMIPRGSDSLCLYDTRALSDDLIENMKMLKQWLIRGVRHGELVKRASDDANLKPLLKSKVRKSGQFSGRLRVVNFVIMVVNGISVLESMDSDDEGKKQYTEMIAAIFKCPFLSFKDDNPVIVVTHGDLLTLPDRARLRVYLGNLLGVPPKTQVFDIPDGNNKAAELAIVDLLSHCLDRADRNLPPKVGRNLPPKADRNWPPKRWFIGKINMLLLLTCILLMGIGYIIPSMPGRFVQYKSPDCVPSGMSKSSDPAPSGVNNLSDYPAPSGVNKPPDHAPGVNKPAPHSGVNKPSVPAPSGVNTPPDPAPSDVNEPTAPLDVNEPAPHSGVNEPAPHSGMNETPHSGMNEPAPSGVNEPVGSAPSGVNKPAHSCVNKHLDPAPSGVNRCVPLGVNKPPDPALSGLNRRAPSGVNKLVDPDTSNVRINWHEIRHLW